MVLSWFNSIFICQITILCFDCEYLYFIYLLQLNYITMKNLLLFKDKGYSKGCRTQGQNMHCKSSIGFAICQLPTQQLKTTTLRQKTLHAEGGFTLRTQVRATTHANKDA